MMKAPRDNQNFQEPVQAHDDELEGSDVRTLFQRTSVMLDDILEDLHRDDSDTTDGLMIFHDYDDSSETSDADEELSVQACRAELNAIQPPTWIHDTACSEKPVEDLGDEIPPSLASGDNLSTPWKAYLNQRLHKLSKDAVSMTGANVESAVRSFVSANSFGSIEDLEIQVRVTPTLKHAKIDKEDDEGPRGIYDQENGEEGQERGCSKRKKVNEDPGIKADHSLISKSVSSLEASSNLILTTNAQLCDDRAHFSTHMEKIDKASTQESEVSSDSDETKSTRRYWRCSTLSFSSRARTVVGVLVFLVVFLVVVLAVTFSGNEVESVSTGTELVPPVSQQSSTLLAKSPNSTKAPFASNFTEEFVRSFSDGEEKAGSEPPSNAPQPILVTTRLPPSPSPTDRKWIEETLEVQGGPMLPMETEYQSRAAARAEALRKQQLRTASLWGNVQHPEGPTSIHEPPRKKAAQRRVERRQIGKKLILA